MKKLLFVLPIFILFASCSRQSTKLNFIKNVDREFEQIMADAKQKKKIIFVDVYTTWCGPCKWMDENTFTDARVAEKFNKKFINYKVDGESFAGVNLALKYNVDAFPTYLFLDGEGNVIKRMEGMMYPESFLREVEELDNLAKN
jgi:thioredoxin 1